MNATIAVIFVVVFVIGVVTGMLTVVAMAAVRRERGGPRDPPNWPGAPDRRR